MTDLETGGSLEDLEKSNIILTEDEAMEYFTMILLGLNHMHSFNKVHRDLKPANILINKQLNWRKILKIVKYWTRLYQNIENNNNVSQ